MMKKCVKPKEGLVAENTTVKYFLFCFTCVGFVQNKSSWLSFQDQASLRFHTHGYSRTHCTILCLVLDAVGITSKGDQMNPSFMRFHGIFCVFRNKFQVQLKIYIILIFFIIMVFGRFNSNCGVIFAHAQ